MHSYSTSSVFSSAFLLGAFAAIMLYSPKLFAQNDAGKPKTKQIVKTISIERDNDDAKVTIKTVEDGQETVQVLTGDAARAYMKENGNISEKETSTVKNMRVTVDIEKELEAVGKDLEEISEQLEVEMEKVRQQLEEMDIEGMLKDIDIEIREAAESFQYSFKTNNAQQDISIRETGPDGNGSVKVEVHVSSDGTSATAKAETSGEYIKKPSSKSRSEFTFYPNPAGDQLHITFDTDEKETTEISIRDMAGKELAGKTVKGKGHQQYEMDISELPAGTYVLELRQGERATAQTLVIE